MLFFLFSCQENVKEENRSELYNTQVETDSTLFILVEDDFEAVLKRKNDNSRGMSNGPNLWQRSGSLPSILSELYTQPLDIENNPNPRATYSLKITWNEATTLENIRAKVSYKLEETFSYTIESKIRQQQSHRMLISDASFLNSMNEGNPVGEDTESKLIIDNYNWEYYGTLIGLADLITEKTGRRIITENEVKVDTEKYYFELTAESGFEGLAKQLEVNYGIVFEEVTVSMEFLVIDFE